LPSCIRRRIHRCCQRMCSARLRRFTLTYYAFTPRPGPRANSCLELRLLWAWRTVARVWGHSIVFWVGPVIIAAYLPWISFARRSPWPGISDPMSLWRHGFSAFRAFVTEVISLCDWQGLLVGIYLLFFFLSSGCSSRVTFFGQRVGHSTVRVLGSRSPAHHGLVSLSRPSYNQNFCCSLPPDSDSGCARSFRPYPGLFMRERTPYVLHCARAANRSARQIVGLSVRRERPASGGDGARAGKAKNLTRSKPI